MRDVMDYLAEMARFTGRTWPLSISNGSYPHYPYVTAHPPDESGLGTIRSRTDSLAGSLWDVLRQAAVDCCKDPGHQHTGSDRCELIHQDQIPLYPGDSQDSPYAFLDEPLLRIAQLLKVSVFHETSFRGAVGGDGCVPFGLEISRQGKLTLDTVVGEEVFSGRTDSIGQLKWGDTSMQLVIEGAETIQVLIERLEHMLGLAILNQRLTQPRAKRIVGRRPTPG